MRSLPKHIIKARQKTVQRDNRKFGAQMQEIDISKLSLPPDIDKKKPERAFRSNRFLAMLYPGDHPDIEVRISVCRTAIRGDGEYVDGITWDELMMVKAECGYAYHDALEVYPALQDIVNISNIRHLFVLQEELAWKWKNEK